MEKNNCMTKLEETDYVNLYADNFKYNYDLMQSISESLLILGFRPRLKGFIYVKEAIYLYANASFVNSIFKDIYSIIARKYNVTALSIDNAIKTVIHCAWYKDNINKDHELFKWSTVKTGFYPTNSEFIATMADLIRLKVMK